RRDGDALAADLATRARVVGVVAHEGGHVEGGGQPRLTLAEEEVEARVRVGCGAEPGELAHGPQASAVHARIDAAGVRVLAGKTDARRRVTGDVFSRVEGLERHVRHGREADRTLRGLPIPTLEPVALRHVTSPHASGPSTAAAACRERRAGPRHGPRWQTRSRRPRFRDAAPLPDRSPPRRASPASPGRPPPAPAFPTPRPRPPPPPPT